MIGAMNRIEIWDATSWQTYSDQQEQAFADLSEEVFPGLSDADEQHGTTTARPAARTQEPESQDEVSRPLPPCRLAHLPRCQKALPKRRADEDLVRRTRPGTQHHPAPLRGVEPMSITFTGLPAVLAPSIAGPTARGRRGRTRTDRPPGPRTRSATAS